METEDQVQLYMHYIIHYITVAISKILQTLDYIQPMSTTMTKRLTLPTAPMTEVTSAKVILTARSSYY